MKHRHKKMGNSSVSNEDLNKKAKEYCAILVKRVMKNRIDDSLPNDGSHGFNIPKVVAACTCDIPPFFVCRGRNNNDLQNPHPTLARAYPPVNGDMKPIIRMRGVRYYRVGHCAEPHAAHILLNNMDAYNHPISISDIRFSLAYKVKNQAVAPYCGTCRLTFPQL